MCEPKSYAGKNCATCADALTPGDAGNCGECIKIEMETKVPFTKWRKKEAAK